MLAWVYLWGSFSGLIFISAGHLLVQAYTRESEVVTLATALMGIMAIAAFPQALQQVFAGVLKGAGDTFYIMKYSLISVAVIRPIITYVLCITLGLGLIWGMDFSMLRSIVTACLCLHTFYRWFMAA